MKSLLVTLALCFLAAPAFAKTAAPGACIPQGDCCKVCDKGEPCGDTCIAPGKKCALKPKDCKEGKPCGGGCIAKDKECKRSEHCACKKADVCPVEKKK